MGYPVDEKNALKTITHLGATHSVIDQYMRELRDVQHQQNRAGFRENIRRIGRVIGYEISKTLAFENQLMRTPLSEMSHPAIADELVVVTVLRAGLPLHEGLLDVFPNADNGFVSAYRKHAPDGSFRVEVEYVACPDITNKVVILSDPMLATGQSFLNAWHALTECGVPKAVHLAAVIGSRHGVDSVMQELPLNAFSLWVAAIDPDLSPEKYIVPGLGDAGDLAFGPKLRA